jgi:hypothetical protein
MPHTQKFRQAQWRSLTWIYWSHTPSGESTQNLYYSAGVPRPDTDPQTYDTRNPGPGNSGTTKSTTAVGKWNFTFRGAMAATNCALPNSSNTITREVNVMTCEPKWSKIGNPPVTHHLPATTIQLYIPMGMWSVMVYGPNGDDNGPAVQSVNDWNSILAGVGPQFQITDTPCGSGAECVWMEETTDPISGCASFTGGVPNYGTGVMTTSSTIKFPSGTWSSASSDRLRRSVGHELGHALGMTENTCTGADSIQGTTTSCTSLGTLSPTPTAQDNAQTTTSPYGGGPETVRAF